MRRSNFIYKIPSPYRGKSEWMPLQTRETWTLEKYILSWTHLKSFLFQLQFKHFGWMLHHLNKDMDEDDITLNLYTNKIEKLFHPTSKIRQKNISTSIQLPRSNRKIFHPSCIPPKIWAIFQCLPPPPPDLSNISIICITLDTTTTCLLLQNLTTLSMK